MWTLLNEIPKNKYKKLKKKGSQNIIRKEDVKEISNNKIPYKLNDNVLKKNYKNKNNKEKKIKMK